MRAGRIQAGPRLSHMASASDKYSAEALKCQCRGCSNCNTWRNNPTPKLVKWFRITGNRCGGDIRKRDWENYSCELCNGCYEASDTAEAQFPPGLGEPRPSPAAPSEESEEQVRTELDATRNELVAMQTQLRASSDRISTLENIVGDLTDQIRQMQGEIRRLQSNPSNIESSGESSHDSSGEYVNLTSHQ